MKWMKLTLINQKDPWTTRDEEMIDEFSYIYDELLDVHFHPRISKYGYSQIERYQSDTETYIPPYCELLIQYLKDLEHKIKRRPFHYWEINAR